MNWIIYFESITNGVRLLYVSIERNNETRNNVTLCDNWMSRVVYHRMWTQYENNMTRAFMERVEIAMQNFSTVKGKAWQFFYLFFASEFEAAVNKNI